uniref:PDZ domain-containing protein n=1 Tax=Ditylenchus dipsaci TaxID=166011 RepID=A0A915CV88_9BILA
MVKLEQTAEVIRQNSSMDGLSNGDANQRELIKVELRRDENGLGFNIVGGTDQQHIPTHSDIFISRIRPGTPAATDHRLRQGDIIVSVNGIDLSAVKHEEAIKIFQSVGSVCQLLVEQGGERRILMEPAGLMVASSNTNSIGSSNSSLKAELKSILKSPSPNTDNYADIVKKDLNDSTSPGDESFTSMQYMTPLSTPANGSSSRQVLNSNSTPTQSADTQKRSREISLSSVSYAEVADPCVDTPSSQHNWMDGKSSEADVSMGGEDDRVSMAPSLLDDVPRTPKRPTSRFLDPINPSVLTEALFVTVGVVALGAIIFFGYRKMCRADVKK